MKKTKLAYDSANLLIEISLVLHMNTSRSNTFFKVVHFALRLYARMKQKLFKILSNYQCFDYVMTSDDHPVSMHNLVLPNNNKILGSVSASLTPITISSDRCLVSTGNRNSLRLVKKLLRTMSSSFYNLTIVSV